ncbi:MAG: hypothetical protein MK080_01010 [Opitutales bacterium]|nr:hypothetical protein [Opitutales bacterium]
MDLIHPELPAEEKKRRRPLKRPTKNIMRLSIKRITPGPQSLKTLPGIAKPQLGH